MNDAHLIRWCVVATDVQLTLGRHDDQADLETLAITRWRSERVYETLHLRHVFASEILLFIKLGVELEVCCARSNDFDLYNDNRNQQLFFASLHKN